jgi:hypothetical protein
MAFRGGANTVRGYIQDFLAGATQSAANDLVAALDRIPVERRRWQPALTARSPLDQFAECAILNGNTADLLRQRAGKPLSYGEEYGRIKDALLEDEPTARALLTQNTERAIAAINGIPDDAWDEVIPLPWGSMTLRELVAYPCWNMIYHTGQIDLIALLLEGSETAEGEPSY